LSVFGKSSEVIPLVSNPGIGVQAGALMWSHQENGLCIVFGSFCPQGKLQLGAEVTHCQFMQVVRTVVFTRQHLHYPTAAILFGWLLPQHCGAIQF
jgi:hypothetical protein